MTTDRNLFFCASLLIFLGVLMSYSLKNAINFKACLSLSDKPIQSHYSVKYP